MGELVALSTADCQPVACNLFWANETDHTGLCPPIGQDGNFSADPLVVAGSAWRVGPDSPCRSAYCGLIGAPPR